MKTRSLLTAAVTLLIVFMSCDKVVENTYVTEYVVDDPIYAFAFISTEYYYYYSQYYSVADVVVNNYDTVPEITINGIPPNNPYYYDFDYNDTIFLPGTKCDLRIKVGSRVIEGTAYVPRTFDVIQPAENETVTGTDLNIRWSSAGSDHYEVYVEYHFHDDANMCHWDYFIEPAVKDTTLSKAGFLPTVTPGSTWYYGFIGITAIDGPPLTPGTPANITGDGGGFLWTYNYCWGSYFNVAGSPMTPMQPDPNARRIYPARVKADIRNRMAQAGMPVNPEE